MGIDPAYARDGFLTDLPILTPDEALGCRESFDALEREIGPDRAAVGLVQEHLRRPDLWALAVHGRVLDAAERALGPDLVLMATHFFCKYPAGPAAAGGPAAGGDTGRFVAWHQDVTYWGFDPPEAATVWLAVDDADRANGCMRVLPGSHRLGQLPHGTSPRAGNLLSVNQEIPAERVPDATPVDVELHAGRASVHDGLLIHGSLPNRSHRRRCGLTIRFCSPRVALREEPNRQTAWAPILVRGEDRFRRLALRPPPSF